MAHCGSSETSAKLQAPRHTADTSIRSPQAAVDQNMKPVLFEVYGEIWTVQSRLGQGVSASVYRVSSDRATAAAVKEFQADTQGGDYGFHKERSVFEDIHGHKNIGNAASVGMQWWRVTPPLWHVSIVTCIQRVALTLTVVFQHGYQLNGIFFMSL